MTTDRDAELSALLDGALSAAEESALRDEIAHVPVLAARLEELAHVDATLRALPTRPVPGDLRARLQAKLDAEPQVRPQLSALRGGAVARPRRRRAWIAGFGAAAAAAAAALLVVVGDPPAGSGPAGAGDLAVKPPAATAPDAVDDPLPPAIAGADPRAGTSVSEDEDDRAAPEQIARVEPAPEPLPRNELEPEPALDEVAEGEGTELPPAVEPTRVAIEEPSPITSAFQDAESASAPEQLALASPPLYVEVTDDEADALAELELRDATIVGVLDLLGELDELEAEAS